MAHERLSRVRHPLAERARRDVAAARGSARAAARTAVHGADAPRRAARRCRAVGARAARRLGGRDRQAARLALRTPPLEALAEDEVRARRRSSWSADSPTRKARASASAPCSWATTKGRTSCLRDESAPASIPSCCSICAGGSTRIEIPKPPFTKAVGLPRLRAHWVRPEIVVQVGFIEWTGNDKLRHPRLLGVRFDKSAREVIAGTLVITHPEKVLFPDDGITKGDLAAYYEAVAPMIAAAPEGPPADDGAVSRRHRRQRASGRRMSRRDSPSGCSASGFPTRTASSTTPSSPTSDR